MLTFTKLPSHKGSNSINVNVDRNGRPFGTLWTFRNTKTERHPWHAKPLNGEHKAFYGSKAAAYRAAVAYLESEAVRF